MPTEPDKPIPSIADLQARVAKVGDLGNRITEEQLSQLYKLREDAVKLHYGVGKFIDLLDDVIRKAQKGSN